MHNSRQSYMIERTVYLNATEKDNTASVALGFIVRNSCPPSDPPQNSWLSMSWGEQ